jgi:glycosyltransferase involved in cell wall biosynthesis
MFTPLVSICIPAYKQPALLQRCLDSIAVQTYKNIEIIISDDSDDDSIAKIAKKNSSALPIKYYRNATALGSPANWNNAIDKATGALYLLLHHDDYLAREDSLQQYCISFERQPEIDGFFSKSTPVNDRGEPTPIKYDPEILKNLLQEPDHLIRSNQIGPPSNLMLRTSVHERYDTRLLWLVDIEFYIRLIKRGHKLGYIDERLVYIGIHTEQITRFCMNNPHIVLWENLLMANQAQPVAWKNLQFYDYFWRLFRNNRIDSEEGLWKLGVERTELLPALRKMLTDLSKVPVKLRFNGIVSKASMFWSWLRNGD